MTTWNTEKFETFTFISAQYDVRAAKQILASKKRTPKIHQLAVADVEPLLAKHTKEGNVEMITMGVTVDWSRAESDPTIDLDVPIIVAQTAQGNFLPIDGYHRIAKAVKVGKTHLPCVVLNKAETKKILL